MVYHGTTLGGGVVETGGDVPRVIEGRHDLVDGPRAVDSMLHVHDHNRDHLFAAFEGVWAAPPQAPERPTQSPA
jgi:hypothetical protein